MNENWPICGRIAHLLGGAIATNQPNDKAVLIWPTTLDGKRVEISLSSYQKFYEDIQGLGCQIIGIDFYTHTLEATGVAPPEWRYYARDLANAWLHWETRQKWSEVGFHAAKNNNGLLYDIANRIRYQLAAVSERLRFLSCSYQDQLNARTVKGDFKPAVKFEDGYTKKIYLNFHSFLFDSCILRNYLAEFVYNYSENGYRRTDGVEITTAAGLIKVLNKISAPNIIEQEFISITSEAGWLFKLGAYRDLVMHAAPLAIAHKKLFAVCDTIDLVQDKKLPVIRCPLPEDPSLISRIRASRTEYSKYLEKLEDFIKASQGEIPKFDCLQYAHEVIAQLTCLSLKVMSLSPIPPQKIYLTKTDIIGDIEISKDQ